MRWIRILDQEGNPVKPLLITTPIDKAKDMAFIFLNDAPYANIPFLHFGPGNVLDEILTMGYPQISGFPAIQVAETANISAVMKSSLGRIVADEAKYHDDDLEYYLISARVKGGNSGGPIINKVGYAVGMVIESPLDSQDPRSVDRLGYSVALKGKDLHQFIEHSRHFQDSIAKNLIKSIPFEITNNGFKTLF